MRILDERDFHRTLAATPGLALVMFSGPDCGACRAMERYLGKAASGVALRLFKVDVEKATALARQFDIFHLPGLLLYRDGHFHAVVDAEPTRLAAEIVRLGALPAQEEP